MRISDWSSDVCSSDLPKSLSFASAGAGSMPHLCAELMASLAQVHMMHVPFKGTGPALTDLVAGRVSMLFSGAPAVDGLVPRGKLQARALSTKARTEEPRSGKECFNNVKTPVSPSH